MDPGTELRKEFIRIHPDNSVIAKKIGAAYGVAIARMVIHLPNGVLRAVLIGKAEVYLCALPCIGSIKAEQISAQRIRCEGCPIGSGLGNEVGRRIGNTNGAITGGTYYAAIAGAAPDGSTRRSAPWKRIADRITLGFETTKVK